MPSWSCWSAACCRGRTHTEPGHDLRNPRRQARRGDAELGRLKNVILDLLDLHVPPAPAPDYFL
ncbi:MAG: hypothetical protein ACHQ1F_10890 [Spirochaetia bacterium]